MQATSHDDLANTMVTKNDLTSYGATARLLEAMEGSAPTPLQGLNRPRMQYYHQVAGKHGVKFLDKDEARQGVPAGYHS